MRNHQQADPEDATIAKLGDATLTPDREIVDRWIDDIDCNGCLVTWQSTDILVRYGATFWKPIEPEPGYRLVEDHERVGEKPKGCRIRCKDGSWNISYAVEWANNETYAVPIKQVVAWSARPNDDVWAAYFANQEDRDRAVREANEREL